MPDNVSFYNKSMGGVNLADHLISFFRIQNKSMKLYQRIFSYIIDMVIINAWFHYRRHVYGINITEQKQLYLFKFRHSVAKTVMAVV